LLLQSHQPSVCPSALAEPVQTPYWVGEAERPGIAAAMAAEDARQDAHPPFGTEPPMRRPSPHHAPHLQERASDRWSVVLYRETPLCRNHRSSCPKRSFTTLRGVRRPRSCGWRWRADGALGWRSHRHSGCAVAGVRAAGQEPRPADGGARVQAVGAGCQPPAALAIAVTAGRTSR